MTVLSKLRIEAYPWGSHFSDAATIRSSTSGVVGPSQSARYSRTPLLLRAVSTHAPTAGWSWPYSVPVGAPAEECPRPVSEGPVADSDGRGCPGRVGAAVSSGWTVAPVGAESRFPVTRSAVVTAPTTRPTMMITTRMAPARFRCGGGGAGTAQDWPLAGG